MTIGAYVTNATSDTERREQAEKEVLAGAAANAEPNADRALMLENATQTVLLRQDLAQLSQTIREGQMMAVRSMIATRKRQRGIAGMPGIGVVDQSATGEAEPPRGGPSGR